MKIKNWCTFQEDMANFRIVLFSLYASFFGGKSIFMISVDIIFLQFTTTIHKYEYTQESLRKDANAYLNVFVIYCLNLHEESKQPMQMMQNMKKKLHSRCILSHYISNSISYHIISYLSVDE